MYPALRSATRVASTSSLLTTGYRNVQSGSAAGVSRCYSTQNHHTSHRNPPKVFSAENVFAAEESGTIMCCLLLCIQLYIHLHLYLTLMNSFVD